MKCQTVIDPAVDEEVVIRAHRRTKLVETIEQLVREDKFELVGYKDREGVRLELLDICCFTVEQNRVFAMTESDKWQLKYRLYQLEERLPQIFVKINQSCIANLRKVTRFGASVTGSLMVTFQNGHVDYVSRRNLKTVKERLGV